MLFAAGVFLSDAGINQQNRGEKWGWGEEFAPLIFLFYFSRRNDISGPVELQEKQISPESIFGSDWLNVL